MTISRVKPSATVLVVATALLAGACSSSGETEALESVDDSGATTSTTAVNEVGFEIPDERLLQLEEAQVEPATYDFPDQPAGVPWPTDEWRTGTLPDDVDAAAVDAAIDMAFNEVGTPDHPVKAVLAVHGGELVIEEYNPAALVTADDRLPAFSINKSFKSALVGILAGDDRLDIWSPAPVPEWSDPTDPRHSITIDQMLRMSSGLEMNDLENPELAIELFTSPDPANWAANRPLIHDPDTVWAYATGTSSIIDRILDDEVGGNLTAWARDALYEPLGMDSVDDTGGITTLTAADYARFGLLYLRGGVWDGEQLLPDGWVDYSATQTPTLPSRSLEESGTNCCRSYGLFWFLDHRPGAFHANGANGQAITVVPRLDLVVVVLSDLQDISCTQTADSDTIDCGSALSQHDVRNAIADAFET